MIENKELFDSLFTAMLEGVALYRIVQDASGRAIDYRFINVNPSFETQTGVHKDQLVGKLASEVYGTATAPYLEIFTKVAASGEPTRFETYCEMLDKHFVVSVFSQGKNRFVTVFSDVTASQHTMNALQKARQELLEAQRISHTGSWQLDLATNQQVWSEELYLMLGLDPSLSPPEYPQAERLFTAQSWAQLSKAISNTAETGVPYELEMEMIRADGSHGWMLGRGEAVRNNNGDIVALRGVASDITMQKNTELALRNEKAFTDKLINLQIDTFFLFDPATGKPIRWNESFTRASGYSNAEIAAMSVPADFYDKEDCRKAQQTIDETFTEREGSVELNLITRLGKRIPFEYRVTPIEDNNGATLFLALGRDITDRKRAEEKLRSHEAELRRIAHYDTLTAIPNRLLLSDRMKQAIEQTTCNNKMMAVCYLDLDGFKPINDLYGHDAGDQVLIEIANRISNTIRGTDTVARLGGDEFVVLLQNLNHSDECVTTLERLLEYIAQPIAVKENLCTVSASIGVSIYPLENKDPDTLLRHADQAMYVAKQSGKNCYYIYDPTHEQHARDRLEFHESIRRGLEDNQFILHYQPKISLRTKELVGAEALIRWQHPQRGLLVPADFLHGIENTDLHIQIGEWVIATALAQLNCWHQAGLDIAISVNISGHHIESSSFVEQLQTQLRQYPKIQPDKFQIEVLETVALSDINIVRKVIESCHKMGIGFALDDFGTGYSSLTYLSRLPIDVLKIDQSFIHDMLEDKGDMAIVQGIIVLARTFDRQIVAEGIETKEHYQMLLQLGCELGQGYYIASPMPATDFGNWQSTSLRWGVN